MGLNKEKGDRLFGEKRQEEKGGLLRKLENDHSTLLNYMHSKFGKHKEITYVTWLQLRQSQTHRIFRTTTNVATIIIDVVNTIEVHSSLVPNIQTESALYKKELSTKRSHMLFHINFAKGVTSYIYHIPTKKDCLLQLHQQKGASTEKGSQRKGTLVPAPSPSRFPGTRLIGFERTESSKAK